jgi:hypothetical protein
VHRWCQCATTGALPARRRIRIRERGAGAGKGGRELRRRRLGGLPCSNRSSSWGIHRWRRSEEEELGAGALGGGLHRRGQRASSPHLELHRDELVGLLFRRAVLAGLLNLRAELETGGGGGNARAPEEVGEPRAGRGMDGRVRRRRKG